MKRFMLVTICLLVSMAGWAQGVVTEPGVGSSLYIGGIAYKVTSTSPRTVKVVNNYDTYTQAGVKKTYTGIVVIPETITYSNEFGSWSYSVTGIDDNAFQYGSGMTALTIPNTVTSISSSAFTNATGLTSLIISDGNSELTLLSGTFMNSPIKNLYIGRSIACSASPFKGSSEIILSVGNGITSVFANLFGGATSLETIQLPSEITTIGEDSFWGCSSLSEFFIPNTVTTIDKSAFGYCSSLKNFIIEDGDQELGLDNNWYSMFYKSTIDSLYLGRNIRMLNGSSVSGLFPTGLTKLSIGNSVTNLIAEQFKGCSSLQKVHFGKNITSMGSSCFKGCSMLESINLTSRLQIIPNSAFSGCSSLQSVVILSEITTIGEDSFWGCSSLSEFFIPNTVTTIDKSAFGYCSSLKNFIIEDGDQELGLDNNWYSMFYKSTIDSLYLGRNIRMLNGSSVSGLFPTGLTKLSIGNSVTNLIAEQFKGYSSLQKVHFGKNITSMGERCFSGCSMLESINLTSRLQIIPNSAFSGCSSLQSVVIPEGITTIGQSSFWGCSALLVISIPNSVTTVGKSAFYNCKALKDVIIEDGEDEIGFDNQSSGSNYIFGNCSIDSLYMGRNIKMLNNTSAASLFTSKFTKLTLGNKVKAIISTMFSSCSLLEKIYPLWEEPITTTKSVFPNAVYTNATLLVPGGTVKKYKATSAWNEFANIVPTSIGVTMTATEGGSIRLGDEVVSNDTKLLQVKPNSVLTFELAAEDTHFLESLTMNGEDVTAQVVNGQFTPSDLSEDLEMAATFTPKPYFDVTVTSTAGGSAVAESTSVMWGKGTTITFTPDEGREFVSVTVNGTDKTEEVADGILTLSDIQENMTVEATFQKFRYAITAEDCENGSIELSAEEVEWGDSTVVTFKPASHYELATVSVNGEEMTAQTAGDSLVIKDIRQNTTVSATFQLQTFAVSETHNIGGTVELSAETAQWGSSVTVTINPDDEHYLESLTVNGIDVTEQVKDGQYIIESIEGNTAVEVEFAAKPYYDITATEVSSVGGTVSVESSSVMWGRGTTITFTPDEGRELVSVTVNGTDRTGEVINGKLTLTDIRENMTIEATFRKQHFHITIITGTGGSITLSDSQPEWGDNITVTIKPDEDYGLATLTIDGTDVTSGVTNGRYVIENVRADKTLEATFRSTVAFITIPESGIMTYCSSRDLDFSGVAGIKAYISTGYDDATGNVFMTRVTNVPAGTGLMVKGKTGTYKVPYTESRACYVNMLKGDKETNTASLQLPEGYSAETLHYVFSQDGEKGDINDDGEVDALDASLVLQHAAKKIDINEIENNGE